MILALQRHGVAFDAHHHGLTVVALYHTLTLHVLDSRAPICSALHGG
jgi:hypothetical protein